MFTNLNRILHFAFVDFLRNKGISIASVFILCVIIMLATSLLFFWGMADYLILQIQDKIDVTAYFKEEVEEKDILVARDEIAKSSVVKSVLYVSRENALENFKNKYKGNEVFEKALLEVGGNPFLPSLNIKTNGDPFEYQEVANILAQEKFVDLIEKVDFSEKKDIINTVFSIRTTVIRTGLILGLILVFIAILVVFNTIKLTVDSFKDEISTMRIVGATNWFIRGPFIIQGAIYGFISFIICFIISILSFHLLSNKISVMLPGFNSFDYFVFNIWIFIALQIVFGVGVSVISSFIAVRRHLKV
jgi:cell division transport system permease protein